MTPVEITHPGMPHKDDPQVETGMKVWDNLTDDEQRELFRTLYRSVLARKRTGTVDHIVRVADSVDSMVLLESTTDLRDKIRESRTRTLVPADESAVDEAIRQLEG